MREQILEQLFDSPVKVKLLRLFLRNVEMDFEISEITRRVQKDRRTVVRELEKLIKVGLIKCEDVKKTIEPPQKKKGRKPRKKTIKLSVYSVNPKFPFYEELSTLVLKSPPGSREKMTKSIKKLGRIKLAVLSGIFLNLESSRTDILVVGDSINDRKAKTFFKNLESEIGRELNFSVLTTEEFKYRHNMFDKFIRQLFEKPHEILINKLKF